MNINIDKDIKNIISLVNKSKFIKAKNLTEKIIKFSPTKDILFNILGVIELKLNNFHSAIKYFKKSLKLNKKFFSAQLNLAITYKKIDMFKESIESYLETINLKPNSCELYNDIALLYKKIKNYDKAITYLNKIIVINSKYEKAYFNLGLIYINLNNLDKAEYNFIKCIEITNNFYEAFFQLAEIKRKKQNYKTAVKLYKKSYNEKSSYKILQTYVEEGSINNYKKEINNQIDNNSNDRRIAAIAAFASKELDIVNTYPFCPDPLEYIYKSSINKHTKEPQKILKELNNEITNQNFFWEPSGRTTVNGFATNNLSDQKINSFKLLEKIIFKELEIYFQTFKNRKINFIQNKPKNFKFISWSNRLKKEGYNSPHIHPSGWVSGVFYLKIPKNIKNNEAGIQFHLYGDDLICKKSKNEIVKIVPKRGDIIMFPSSLFHSTIPFSSNEERVCIAFDLCGLN